MTATRDRLTARAVVVGLLLVIFVNVWPIYGLYVIHISQMVFSYMPMALMIPFVLLALGVNVALRRLRPGAAFSPLELAAVFSMGLIGALFPTMNFTGLILGHMASPYYFASAENRWAEFLHPHLPSWLFPPDREAMRGFFEGLPDGRPIPYGVWVAPLVWWFAFAGAIIWACLCIAVLLRRQWAEHERLPFPAAQVALEMVREEPGSPWPPMLRGRAFWAGAAIPLTVICWNGVSYFLPAFPRIPITQAGGGDIYLHVTRYVPDYYFYFGVNFFIMGFAYWTSLEVLFSIWVFYLMVVVEVGLFNRFGFSVGPPGLWSSAHEANAWQAFGGLAFLVGWGLYTARGHLRAVWNGVWRKAQGVDDSEELMSYRTAAVGLALGGAFIVGWLHASGMALHVIVPFLFGMAVLYVGVAKIIAESGLVYLRGTLMPPTFALYAVGSASIPPASMATFAFSFAYFTDAKSLAMSSAAHCARITAAVRGNKRPVLLALAGAGAAGALTSVLMTLHLGYARGAYNFNAFELQTHPGIFNYYVNQMQTALPPDWKRLGFFGMGSTAMGLLTLLRYRYPWWPLHPVGFAVMETRAVRGTIFSIFLVWVCKLILLRAGGIALYRRGQPLFLGILAGFIVGVALSAAVDTIWFPGHGHHVHHW